jgi:transcriptional antiterminator RfaH
MTIIVPPSGEGLAWHALATKPRQEDRAVENLAAWNVCTLAPKLEAHAGERQKFLFPGYVFALFSWITMANKIRFTHGISYIVSFGGKPAEISDEIINSICRRIDQNGTVIHNKDFEAGEQIRIVSGPLRDFQGVFEKEMPDGERVRILLTTLTFTRSVVVSKYDLRKQRTG